MKFWKRASGAIKDRRSLLKASFTQRSEFRNPDIEAAVIKATTHDESRVDYRNAQRVFAWVRISDDYLRQVLWALSHRMWRTHDWVVVLKGLMLLHGVFCCKVPGIQEIGRLPFDMMNFKDKHTKRGKLLGLNEFIRAYYAFLDEKSSFIFFHSQEQRDRRVKERMASLSRDASIEEQKEKSMIQDLIWMQNLQGLLDLLLHILPKSKEMLNVLVLEAMDCVVIEIYDICGRICNGIGSVLATINCAGEYGAKMALSILQKAKVHHEELPVYLEFCREIGVGNASECPKMEEIPEERMRELEQIINRNSEQHKIEQSPNEEEKSIIFVEHHNSMKTDDLDNSKSSLKTVITDDWEVFQDQHQKSNQDLELIDLVSSPAKNNARINHLVQQNIVELPDLISF
ncbi:hypothetical protein L2E82_12713 [Cichorium intybus]|uniref:Uncharacterized protein n=1 Tax=Cichorium intybus TaxID=13427 RepID=A0ACB9GI22_CICIN|nr:hypothetical protein L2E82_12713 [Cichorium intybus]